MSCNRIRRHTWTNKWRHGPLFTTIKNTANNRPSTQQATRRDRIFFRTFPHISYGFLFCSVFKFFHRKSSLKQREISKSLLKNLLKFESHAQVHNSFPGTAWTTQFDNTQWNSWFGKWVPMGIFYRIFIQFTRFAKSRKITFLLCVD